MLLNPETRTHVSLINDFIKLLTYIENIDRVVVSEENHEPRQWGVLAVSCEMADSIYHKI